MMQILTPAEVNEWHGRITKRVEDERRAARRGRKAQGKGYG
jgi:hypothetical protein